ncbi:MAG: CheY-like chemotaxis protein [Candidatus Azotimanducaceae bacterium]|jgi:CheY-like chemotaxis protein
MKILVVDDQAANRGLLSYLLEEDGHEVIEASDGEEGVKKFDEYVPDLVLMDVMMPGMDGYETAELIKSKSQKHVPIIFLTALSDDVSLSRCIESGGDDFLTKPVNEVLLNAKIKAHERIRELNNELSQKNDELLDLHGVLKQESELAEYVYDHAISQNLDFKNVKSYLSPMGGFSGDVIFVEMSNRGTLFIMLGDFTGHGLPAALGALPISQQFKYLAQQGVSLGDLVEQINITLHNYLPGNMFCAANLIELNSEGDRVNCWSGGLPDILLIDEEGRVRKAIKSQHLALGVLSEKNFKRDVVEINMDPGERLIMYSDGVTDCSDINGEMLGEARFEMMFDGRTKGDDLFDSLVSRMQTFGRGRPQDDDVSMLELVIAAPEEDSFRSMADSDLKTVSINVLPWGLSTKLNLSLHREFDLISKVVSLFANRSWLRSRKDHIYHVALTQFRYLVDNQILSLEWDELGLNFEDDQRQSERSKAMDKLEAKFVYMSIIFDPESSSLKMIMSNQNIDSETILDEYRHEVVNNQRISFVDKRDGVLTLVTEVFVL